MARGARKSVNTLTPPADSPAQDLLATSAGALATILGVAFSLTVVTLQLAAVQYTSRILRRFMKDRTTQMVLGTFLGTVAYLLLVLRAMAPSESGQQAQGFVPPLSWTLGMVLVLACLTLLAIFLHHLTRSIQAATLITVVGRETIVTLEKLGMDAPDGGMTDLEPPEGQPQLLTAPTAGYLQRLDEAVLLEAAPADCTFIRVEAHTGHFLLPGQPLASVWSARPLEARAVARLRSAFAQGRERTSHQDVLFGVRQLVDIALRALSPGVNDVTTALMVVNELGAVGHAVATSRAGRHGGYRASQREGRTVLIPRLGTEEFLEHAFEEISRAAMGQPRVLLRVVEVLTELAYLTPGADVREAMVCAGRRVQAMLERAELFPHEAVRLRERLARLAEARGGRPAHLPNTS